jgi:hypothetical protein
MPPVKARLEQWAIEALAPVVKSVVKSPEAMRFMHPYPLPFLARLWQWAIEALVTNSGSYTTPLVCVCVCERVSERERERETEYNI